MYSPASQCQRRLPSIPAPFPVQWRRVFVQGLQCFSPSFLLEREPYFQVVAVDHESNRSLPPLLTQPHKEEPQVLCAFLQRLESTTSFMKSLGILAWSAC